MKKINTILGVLFLSLMIFSGQESAQADELETTTQNVETVESETTTQNVEGTTNNTKSDIKFKATITAGWVKTDKGYKYRYSNGKYATYGFINVDGKKYFINKKGYRASGIITYKNKKYYVVNGALYNNTGIIKYKKNKYYCKKGVLKTGLKKVKKSYYYFDKKNYKMVKNKLLKIKGTYYEFAKSGKGTKKSEGAGAAIDLINKITSPKDSKQEKLRKGFNYMVKNYHYQVKPGYFSPSGKGWEENFGYNMITTHGGRCYSFAAAFCLYAREVGYTANAVIGTVSGNILHAWCEVKQGGTWYIYDTELAAENNNNSGYYKRTYASLGGFYHK